MAYRVWARCVLLVVSVACDELPGEDAGATRDAGGDRASRGDGGTRDGGDDASLRDAGEDAADPDATLRDGLPLGAACATAEACASELCVDGVCCISPCGECGECVAPSGTCVDIASGTDPDACLPPNSCTLGTCVQPGELGALCVRDGDCDSNECVDGVCCTTASCGGCESCALGGGVCNALLNAEDPNGACSGNRLCDGSGACRVKDGEDCGSSAACASGMCTDGVCCTESCGECEACTGPNGTCEDITSGPDPNSCTAPSTCSAAGACITPGPLGAECDHVNDCESGACTDGVCCTTDACGTCQSCAVGGGSCATLTNQADPDTCGGDSTCDAAGVCRLAAGAACEAPAQCASDSCVTERCCTGSCSGACRGCDGSGACVAVTNQDGPDCGGDLSCSSEGECLSVDREQLVAGDSSLSLFAQQFLAQTWTAGRSGQLVELRLALDCQPGVLVGVLIGPVLPDGSPNETGFAAISIAPGARGFGELYAIAMPEVAVEAGDVLAVSLQTEGDCRMTAAPFDGDYYPGGQQYARGPTETMWSSSGFDLMFQILMRD